jgi:hypothetical protein
MHMRLSLLQPPALPAPRTAATARGAGQGTKHLPPPSPTLSSGVKTLAASKLLAASECPVRENGDDSDRDECFKHFVYLQFSFPIRVHYGFSL